MTEATATVPAKTRKPRTDIVGPMRAEMQIALGKAMMTANYAELETTIDGLIKRDVDRTRDVYDELVKPLRAFSPPNVIAIFDRIESKLAPQAKIDGIIRVTNRRSFFAVPKADGLEDVGALRVNVFAPTDAAQLAGILSKGKKVIVLEVLTEAEYNAQLAAIAQKIPPGPVPGQTPALASAVARAA